MTQDPTVYLPAGFLAAGINAGIKNAKRDLGLLVSDGPSVFAACLTTNKTRAHPVNRAARVLEAGRAVRAVVVNSGNANALTGPEGAARDERMARAVAERLGVLADEVLTASTGSIGVAFPIETVEAGVPKLVGALSDEAEPFARAIMTTDRVQKIASREVFVAGTRVRLVAMTKGAGMIQPSMATMLCFVATDVEIAPSALQAALRDATDRSFNQITVDNDMSTNDAVMVLANGFAENARIEGPGAEYDAFAGALAELLEEAAVSIARDGEGATRLLICDIVGATSDAEARSLALGVCGGSLVKSAVFGADPYAWGRVLGALGARAATIGAALEVPSLTLRLQDETVFRAGAPVPLSAEAAKTLKARMAEPEIQVVAELGLGEGHGRAWGCDLTYDYVTINADYAGSGLSVKRPDAELATMVPGDKKSLLIEALRYIYRFNDRRAVIKLGGAAMIDPALEKQFAEDVLLLESVGLRPIVVHGGGPEISKTLDKLGHATEFVDGLRVTDEPSMHVVEMVLSGKVNQGLVAALNRTTSKGVGVSGKDGSLLRARKVAHARDLGRVGEVAKIDTGLIDMLIEAGRIPVVSPIGLGDDGIAYNINADVVAAELAAAAGATKLIFLSDVPGFLEDGKVVPEMTGDQLKARIDRGEVKGGMLPKLQAALRALAAGVESVHLVDGRVPHNLIAELFTDRGVGTLIRRS